MIDRFDITMTATLRPELIKRTLESHIEYLFKEHIKKARLIINIDPAGAESPEEITDLKEYIWDLISFFPFYKADVRTPKTSHFPTAFWWCMKQIREPLFFHLEEDWELLQEIDFEKMVSLFSEYPKLVHLRLSAFGSETDKMKNWNKWIPWNGAFFEVPDNLKGVIGWAGHPALNRTYFMRRVLPFVNLESNPEKQIKGHTPFVKEFIPEYSFGCFHKPNTPKALVDIGRTWMKEKGYQKKGSKAFFVNWEKIEEK